MCKEIFNFKNHFWTSWGEILVLLFFIFLPLLINLIIVLVTATYIQPAIESKIVPGEIVAYCLSLISPLFVFLLKSHGYSYKLFALKPVFIIAMLIYILAMTLTIIAKNELIQGIDLKSGHRDTYMWISLAALLVAIILRFYTEFHNSRFSDYKSNIDSQQEEFNNSFINSINKNG